MKKGLFLAFILCLVSVSTFFAQQNQAFTKDVLPVSPEISPKDKNIRNPHATTIVVEGVTIDKKVAKYFAAGELETYSAKQAKRINHLYLDSYEMVNSNKTLSKECLDKIKNSFDLSNHNHLRKTKDRVVTPVFFDGCEFMISLFSWEEIDKL